MWTDLPSSDHSGEDVHEQSDIDEPSLETDVGNIADPDLILSRDLKGLNSIDPRLWTFKGSRGLTDTLDRDERFSSFINRATRLYPTVYP